jgi:predicted dehydrogenase
MNMRARSITRRGFLRSLAAGAAVAPYAITSQALGGPGKAAASERLGLGFIGLGVRGNQIMPGFLGRGTQCLAACDVWQNRRDAVRQRLGGDCTAYRDFRDVLARPDVDAVVIATPEYWHAVIAVMACQAGKDMYCEKALSISVAEGRAMCQAVQRHGRVFQHGTQQRSDGRFRLACELVRNGRIGRLRTIRASVPASESGGHRHPVPVPAELDYDLWLGPSPWIPHCGQAGIGHPGWCFRSDYSPGFILTWGVHHLDIAQWGHASELGGPAEFEGRGVFPKDGFDDAALTWHVECAYADGVRLIFTSENEHPNGVRFEGDDGWTFVSRETIQAEPAAILKAPVGPGDARLERSDDHAQNFLDCVRTRRATVAPVEVAHRSTTIGLVSSIAVLLRRKLRWDSASETFPGDDEANRMLARALRSPWRT